MAPSPLSVRPNQESVVNIQLALPLIRRLTALGVAAGLLVSSFAVHAAIPPTILVPTAPAAEGPVPGTYQGESGNTYLTFTWTQGQAFQGSSGAPPIARYFAICILPYSATPVCNWGGRWFSPAHMIPRVQTFNGIGMPIIGNLRYTYTPPTPFLDTDFDRRLVYVIAACADQLTATCSFSNPREIYLSTREMRAEGFDWDRKSNGNTGSATIWFNSENIGSATPAYNASILIRSVLLDGGACLTNPASPLVRFNDSVLTNQGVFAPGAVPASAIVIGIHRPLLASSVSVSDTFNGIQQPAGQLTSIGEKTVAWAWRAGEVSKGIAIIGKLDYTNLVREYNEDNNARGDCRVVTR